MLSNKLDVLLVPVATQAGNKFAPPIFGVVVVSESRNDSQRRQAGEGFDVVRSLHGVVHIFAQEGEANAADHADKESEGDVARLRRA